MSLQILIVDDQKINRTILANSLNRDGYQTISAGNGEEAITAFEKHQPDIVLLDAIMPIMDGFEAAPKLKALSKDVYLPIIFLTALDDQDSLKKCLEVGGDDFLNKPFDQVILGAKIKAHARIRELSKKTFEQKKQLDFYRLKTEREFQIVEHIFNRALLGNYSAPDHLKYSLSPAAMFNGDVVLSAMGPTGNLYVMMGDFTGHGLASAIGSLPVSRAFYALTRKGLSVPDIASEINHILLNLLPTDMFCAAAIIEMNNSGKNISVWVGGVPDIYIVDDESGISQVIESQHMPLGILSNDEFENDVANCTVKPTERVFVYSDGVPELENHELEMFGDIRLQSMLSNKSTANIEAISNALKDFKGEGEQNDDITMLELRCKPTNMEASEIKENFSLVPHSYHIRLTAEEIKNNNPVEEIINIIAAIKGVTRHKSNLFLLLSEAYNNAIEHGVLNIDSSIKSKRDGFVRYYNEREDKLKKLTDGYVYLQMSYDPKTFLIKIIIEDSGHGFSTDIEDEKVKNDGSFFGRGISLIKEIAADIKFNKIGNQITIQYFLKDVY